MTRHIFRLATPADEPAIRRLQTQFVTEMNDPLGIDEEARQRTDFFLVEVADESGCRAVGMMSLMRASAARFVFEQVFPEAWRHMALPTWLGRLGIRRSHLVEGDWGYIEKPYRGQGLAPLLFAGMMLYAHQRGDAACVGMPCEAALARLPRNTFHTTGLVAHLAGVRYELGLFVLAEIATTMSEIVRAARLRDPRIVWQLPTSATPVRRESPAHAPRPRRETIARPPAARAPQPGFQLLLDATAESE
jgi:GNAT superfamily N-acetyltransferase